MSLVGCPSSMQRRAAQSARRMRYTAASAPLAAAQRRAALVHVGPVGRAAAPSCSRARLGLPSHKAVAAAQQPLSVMSNEDVDLPTPIAWELIQGPLVR